MDKAEIYKLISDAKDSLGEQVPKNPEALVAYYSHGNKSSTIRSVVPEKANQQYIKCARRIFDINPKSDSVIIPSSTEMIISRVKDSKKKSTLRMYARSVRHVSMKMLSEILKLVDKAQREKDWHKVERIVTHPKFKTLCTLARMLPSDFAENWQANSPRKGKKSSLQRLPKNWRELMVAESKGQFTVPMILCMLTGCRPMEIEKGVIVKMQKESLYVRIIGAKVTEKAGQEYRIFELANHPLTDLLIQKLKFNDENAALVKVASGNSVTTHMRRLGKKLWPRRKESITVYTARHAMAAQCKQASCEGGDTDLVSEVLGHVVDKTASYYGNRFQSGGLSVVPRQVKVPRDIRRKSVERTMQRSLPSKKRSKLSQRHPR